MAGQTLESREFLLRRDSARSEAGLDFQRSEKRRASHYWVNRLPEVLGYNRVKSRSQGKWMRLVVLMVEVEQPEGISSRKLVLETARHNVITAYGRDAAIDLLRRFPNVDVAVIHTELEDSQFDRLVSEIKKICPALPIVALSPFPEENAAGVDHTLSSYDPQLLLHLLAERYEAATSDERGS
ncbi:MAG: response regulator [Silvibacterium sp.]|nr:response regulator [Silvibacterium sp.]